MYYILVYYGPEGRFVFSSRISSFSASIYSTVRRNSISNLKIYVTELFPLQILNIISLDLPPRLYYLDFAAHILRLDYKECYYSNNFTLLP